MAFWWFTKTTGPLTATRSNLSAAVAHINQAEGLPANSGQSAFNTQALPLDRSQGDEYVKGYKGDRKGEPGGRGQPPQDKNKRNYKGDKGDKEGKGNGKYESGVKFSRRDRAGWRKGCLPK